MDTQLNRKQFDEASLHFIEAFSRQAAIAITNAKMLQDLQSENKRLRKQINLQDSFPEIIGKSECY